MTTERMAIKAVMHPFPYSIGCEQNLKTAKDTMLEHNVRHLPVCHGGKVVGILSERDVNFVVAVDKREPCDILVKDAYTADPYIVEPDTTIDLVARHMAHERLGCAVVVEKDKLLGIFTTVDACRTLAEIVSNRYEQ